MPTGLSDHTLDPIAAPAAAVALGATVIEKHFTLDLSMEGPDHEFALEPDQLRTMVETIRNVERTLGSREKRILDVEGELHDIARRSIHATADIDAGEGLNRENVAVLRPGKEENGLAPKYYEEVVGRTAARPIHRGEGIRWEHLVEE